MSVIELDLKLGLKHPGINNYTVRHEISVFDLARNSSVTYSVGNIEVFGGGVDWPTSDSGYERAEKLGGVKADFQGFLYGVPVVYGGTADLLNGELAVRGGVGSTKVNVYAEASLAVDYGALLHDATGTIANQIHFAADGTFLSQKFSNIGIRWKDGELFDVVHVTEGGTGSEQWTYLVPSWNAELLDLNAQNSTRTSADGSISVTRTEKVSGRQETITYISNGDAGYVPLTTKTEGEVFASGSVGSGYGLNGLEQFVYEGAAQGNQSIDIDSNGAHSFGDNDNTNDNDWRNGGTVPEVAKGPLNIDGPFITNNGTLSIGQPSYGELYGHSIAALQKSDIYDEQGSGNSAALSVTGPFQTSSSDGKTSTTTNGAKDEPELRSGPDGLSGSNGGATSGGRPILLDLNGMGVELTELSHSTV